MKEFLVNNYQVIIATWIPAFALFGQSIKILFKDTKIKNDLIDVKNIFNDFNLSSINAIKSVGEVPDHIKKLTEAFLNDLKNQVEVTTQLLEKMTKDLETKVDEAIDKLEAQQHQQIVRIRSDIKKEKLIGESDVSEV